MDRLHEIAELAEKHDPPGCEEGVAWGYAHTLRDVPTQMRGDWAWWVVENLPEHLSDIERRAFMAAIEKEAPLAAVMYRLIDWITAEEAVRLRASARAGLVQFRERDDAGTIRPARERGRG